MLELIHQAVQAGQCAELSAHYYRFLQRLTPEAGELVWLSGALAVQAVTEGHACLSLAPLAGRPPFAELTAAASGGPAEAYQLPPLVAWEEALHGSPLVGGPEGDSALVLEQGRLYLRRYFAYESRLAAEIVRRASLAGYSPDVVAAPLARHLGGVGEGGDWQRVAVAAAALKRLCLITGGPGTGKTHTVVRIIALLQELAGDAPLRIGLAAPTGKAASRMQEAIAAASASIIAPLAAAAPLPVVQAQTIHRLLGYIRHSPYFRHHRQRRLPLDVLIVDEVSMVDLALMTKLVEAMPDDGRLVLLGDKDQLSSVEAGRVLADLCASGSGYSPVWAEALIKASAAPAGTLPINPEAAPLDDCLVELRTSYRFRADSGIGALATAVLAGDGETARQVLASGRGVSREPAAVIGQGHTDDEARLADQLCQGYAGFLASREPQAALAALKGFQVLCVHRHGLGGALHVNAWFEEVLAKRGDIVRQGGSPWYEGRPVMVTGNHYHLRLFNGDMGVALAGPDGGLRVYFEAADGGIRAIALARMPSHETAFALTVHKSQGSEFEEVLLLLPEVVSKLLNRELIYTAITRARRRFSLWGEEEALLAGLARRTERDTGLAERLRQAS